MFCNGKPMYLFLAVCVVVWLCECGCVCVSLCLCTHGGIVFVKMKEKNPHHL